MLTKSYSWLVLASAATVAAAAADGSFLGVSPSIRGHYSLGLGAETVLTSGQDEVIRTGAAVLL